MQNSIISHAGVRISALVLLLGIGAIPTAWAEETVVVEPVEELGAAAAGIDAPRLDADELEKLVAPVALYPDDLLAIVLPASTYPLQVVAAARFRSDKGNDNAEPDPEWDESIVALLNYPEALALLNDDINWTWQLGQAVIAQERELMDAVQSFRKEAYAAGNIDSDDKQNVYVKDEVVVIEPVEEKVVYVPYYEPAEVVVYQPRRVYYYYPRAYPLYYYPYASYYPYWDYGFWGLSSVFTLSWAHHHVYYYNHDHHLHRYYGHRYHDVHFRYTRHYYEPRYRDRRWSHRHDYADNGRWRPHYAYAGARPVRDRYAASLTNLRSERHVVHRQLTEPRHIERRGRSRYEGLYQNRTGFGRSGVTQREQRQAANRIERGDRPRAGRDQGHNTAAAGTDTQRAARHPRTTRDQVAAGTERVSRFNRSDPTTAAARTRSARTDSARTERRSHTTDSQQVQRALRDARQRAAAPERHAYRGSADDVRRAVPRSRSSEASTARPAPQRDMNRIARDTHRATRDAVRASAPSTRPAPSARQSRSVAPAQSMRQPSREVRAPRAAQSARPAVRDSVPHHARAAAPRESRNARAAAQREMRGDRGRRDGGDRGRRDGNYREGVR